jgi:hypothetical protein
VDYLISGLAEHHKQHRDIDMALCVSGLEFGRDHKRVRDFVVKTH